MVRKSKRKPRKSFIDEDDADENSNSNMETDCGRNEGEGGIGGEEKVGVGGSQQQGEVLQPRLLKQQEQAQPMKPNMKERDESETGEEEVDNSLDETMKFEVAEETEKVSAMGLEMSMLKQDASEEKEYMMWFVLIRRGRIFLTIKMKFCQNKTTNINNFTKYVFISMAVPSQLHQNQLSIQNGSFMY